MADKYIVSEVARRIQSTGLAAIEAGELNEVGPGTFSTSPLEGVERGDRLVAHIGASEPMYEVRVADRDRFPADFFDVFEVPTDGFLIRSLLQYDGNESDDTLHPDEVKRLRYKELAMRFPGEGEISLDGSAPRPKIEAMLLSSSLSGYNLPDGAPLKGGYSNRYMQPSSSFAYEFGFGLGDSSGLDRMHGLLDAMEARFEILPSGLAVVDSRIAEARTSVDLVVTDRSTWSDIFSMTAEILGDREAGVVRLRCEGQDGWLMADQLIELGVFKFDFAGEVEKLTDGRRPHSFWSEGGFPPGGRSSTFCMSFGGDKEFAEAADAAREAAEQEPEIDLDKFSSSDVAMMLAMAGWTVIVNREDDETLTMSLSDMGGAKGQGGAELALSLDMIDGGTGELAEGFSISEGTGRVEISYSGEFDENFRAFATALIKSARG